ncbi:hypothetical protein MTP99_007055 [Tenebrio molitor]|nr:hypothetical protein MTP99_007055 [Tenebrio molitor]
MPHEYIPFGIQFLLAVLFAAAAAPGRFVTVTSHPAQRNNPGKPQKLQEKRANFLLANCGAGASLCIYFLGRMGA